MNTWQKIKKTIESCYLCIRFPFLYPRNRFDGKHHANLLANLRYKTSEKAVTHYHINMTLEKPKKLIHTRLVQGKNVVAIESNKQFLLIDNGIDSQQVDVKKLAWNGKFNILGFVINSGKFLDPSRVYITIYIENPDKSDKTNYGFSYTQINLIKNRNAYRIFKFIDKLDDILDKIWIIPKFTELDAMPTGWRKAFGIQFCKDLKSAAKKDKYLKELRIMQLKEKWGYLHLYLNMYGPEVSKVIKKYENLSWNTCITCGKPATKISSGWISPYCDDCYDNYNIVQMEKVNGEWVETKEYIDALNNLYAKNKEEI